MRRVKHTILCRALFTTLTVLLLLFIFGNSYTEGEDSGRLSLMVTLLLNSILERLRIPLELSHNTVRKLAHFAEYSLLGALLTCTVRSWQSGVWRFTSVWLPLVCGAIFASLDEWLQTFVPDRHGCVSDVLLDFSGVLWAALAAALIIRLAEQRKSAGLSAGNSSGSPEDTRSNMK